MPMMWNLPKQCCLWYLHGRILSVLKCLTSCFENFSKKKYRREGTMLRLVKDTSIWIPTYHSHFNSIVTPCMQSKKTVGSHFFDWIHQNESDCILKSFNEESLAPQNSRVKSKSNNRTKNQSFIQIFGLLWSFLCINWNQIPKPNNQNPK